MINTMPTIETPATERVGNMIRGWITQKRLTPGDRLPTELSISQQNSVSRTTVRAALRSLHQDGTIAPVVDGRGWVVAGNADFADEDDGEAAKANRMVGVLSGLGNSQGGNSGGWRVFVLMGILRGLSEGGHTAAVEAAAPAGGREAAARRRAWLATGDVVANPETFARLRRLRETGAPVAIQYDTDEDLPFDRVVSDHAAGAGMLAEWLLARGARRILHYLPVVPPDDEGRPETEQRWVRMRQRGLAEAYARAGLPPPPSVPAYICDMPPTTRKSLLLSTDIAHGFLARAFALDAGWDAVMCMTDGHVAPVKEALRRFGDPARAALPVVGYDNYWNDTPETRLTGHKPDATVDKGNLRLGRALVEVLEQRLARPETPEPIIRLVRPELKVVEA